MREVIELFDIDNTISKVGEAGLLFQVMERFKNVNLRPDRVDNPTMGIIFKTSLPRKSGQRVMGISGLPAVG